MSDGVAGRKEKFWVASWALASVIGSCILVKVKVMVVEGCVVGTLVLWVYILG